MERILVRFEGKGSGVGELTWGQRDIWEGMTRLRSSLGVGGVVPLAAGTSVEDVAEMVRFLVGRHQSLRTRLRFEPDGEPRQVVSSAGEVPLEIVDAEPGEDPCGVASAQWDRYYHKEFDYEGEWPIRVAVVRRRGMPTHLVALCCHLATDGFGAQVLRADLANLHAGRVPPVTALQPLDQARWQRSPAGRRHSESSLRHWEAVLRAIPARRFPEPADKPEPRYREVNFSSPAMQLAATAVAGRTGVGSTSVLLAALAVALAEVTGVNPVFTQLVVNNRFRPGLAEAVSPLCGAGFCVIDGRGTLDEVVDRAWQEKLRACKHAYYDPDRMWDLIARVGTDRGQRIDRACIFNDRRSPRLQEASGPADPRAVKDARHRTTLRWVPPLNAASEPFFFYVNNIPDTIDISLSIDAHAVAPAMIESTLFRMEDVLVDAAQARDTPT